MAVMPTLDDLRRYAVARTLFTPTTLLAAVRRLGFVQADPIRAPARAQDLTLRHRVKGYLAGDLERRYARLPVEEDCLVNYGFLPREHLALMHPRVSSKVWDATTRRRAAEVLAFVQARGSVHPREVDQAFSHGRVTNYWGGTSNASTHLLDGMHYRGMLRVQRRDSGTRIYSVASHPDVAVGASADAQRAAALIDLVVRKYAPLPAASLVYLVRLLGYGAPHLREPLQRALQAARQTLASVRIDGTTWYWTEGENPRSRRFQVDDQVRLLAPFDPVVWDRRRFELFWGWTYRFEAYTPAAKRQFGYYALPLLWRGEVLGWANVSSREGVLQPSLGYASGNAPKDIAFRNALEDELQRLDDFMQGQRRA